LASLLAVAAAVGVTSSPAAADASYCRPTYTQDGWNAKVCINADGSSFAYGHAIIGASPTNCSYYKVYLWSHTAPPRSTSRKSCSTISADTAHVFIFGDVWAELVAWNNLNQEILDLNSPAHTFA
jgi:hypothetical protein